MTDKLLKARLRLLTQQRYLSTAFYRQTVIFSEEVQTMAVSRNWQLFINPRFLDKIAVDEAAGVLFHELLHILTDSWNRLVDAEDGRLREIAIEMAINSIVLDSGMVLPGSGIKPEDYGLRRGLTPEEYYELLMKSPKLRDLDEIRELCPLVDVVDQDKIDDLVRTGQIVQQSREVSESEVRAIAERTIGDSPLKPKIERWNRQYEKKRAIPWDRLLRAKFNRFLRQASGYSSFARPPRDQWISARNIILPGRARKRSPRVFVVIDASGSMASSEGEQSAIMRAIEIVRDLARHLTGEIEFAVVNTQVQLIDKMTANTLLSIEPSGGTAIDDALRELNEKYSKSLRDAIIVVVTDGLTSWPHKGEFPNLLALIIGGDRNPPEWIDAIIVE